MAKKGKRLNEAQKAFVVQRLACFDSPATAAEALRAVHGVEIAPQSAERYDPTKKAGTGLAKQWVDLFERTRKAFLDDIENHVPGANKAVRVKELWHAAQAFKAKGNYVGMADMLERIAKEMGNVHTNRRELTGRDGKPVQLEYGDMTDEQLDAKLVNLLQAFGLGTDGDGESQGDGSSSRTH